MKKQSRVVFFSITECKRNAMASISGEKECV